MSDGIGVVSGAKVDGSTVVDAFTRRYGAPPAFVVRAPGRVNLIGEHTDYNDGFVFPLAIERAVWVALRPRGDGQVVVESVDYGDSSEFAAGSPEHGDPAWSEYLRGSAWSLVDAGYELGGWEGAIASDVPIGAGLSSSAALELATMRSFASVSGFDWEPQRMALLAQRAENVWVGVNCGIMDQTISAVGREGHAVLIDCRTLETRAEPLPPGTAVVILDTATRRGLVDSAYNERRAQCERAAAHFGVPALRDVSVEEFERRAASLEPLTMRRARHVVTENARTLAAADAMRTRDAEALGRLMNESHESLRDDFEVSSDALNAMVAIAREQRGCLGARMTGAGFGGCAVALVERDHADPFAREVAARYERESGRAPQVFVTGATDGTRVTDVAAGGN